MTAELKRILCIDDDRDILEVAKMCLETVGGFEVVICADGTEGIACIRDKAPDLVLLDVMMPGVDGPTIIKAMKADAGLCKVPVIFMTARVQPREIEEYLGHGAIAVIAKPFDPMRLAEQVQAAWDRAQTSFMVA